MAAHTGISATAKWHDWTPTEVAVLFEMASCPICGDGTAPYPCEVCWETCQHHPGGSSCSLCLRLKGFDDLQLDRYYGRPPAGTVAPKLRAEPPSGVTPEFAAWLEDNRQRRRAGEDVGGSWHILPDGSRHPMRRGWGYRGADSYDNCICTAGEHTTES